MRRSRSGSVEQEDDEWVWASTKPLAQTKVPYTERSGAIGDSLNCTNNP